MYLLFAFPFFLGSSISILESSTTQFPHAQHAAVSRCNEVTGIWAPCICRLELCIGWYPCGLKFCKGKPDNTINNNGNASYRCGIKTCRKCNQFTYYVRQKQQCLWDEWPKIQHKKTQKTSKQHQFKSNNKNNINNNNKNNNNPPNSVLNRYFYKFFDFKLL